MANERYLRGGKRTHKTSQGPSTTGNLAAGADEMIEVLVSPTHECNHMYVAVKSNAVVISLDSGETEQVTIAANTGIVLDDLMINPSQNIQAANAIEGSAFTELWVSIW